MKKVPTENNMLHKLVDYYKVCHEYTSLREQTQKDYASTLKRALNTSIEGIPLGKISIKNLCRRDLKVAYEDWTHRGTRTANITFAILRKVLNFAVELEIIEHNPIIGIKKLKEQARKVTWTPEQVKILLDKAYSEWKWRNIGLIVHMAYEFAQRIGDMRELKWTAIDFDKKTLTLEQSKRRATVYLPISDNLIRMLTQQEEDFGFQEYVAPSLTPKNNAYKPYTKFEVSSYINAIKAACELPTELYAMDMRRTGITQMVDSGVDLAQIMSVSGHQNPQSVKPYMKNTLTAATNALSVRKNILTDV